MTTSRIAKAAGAAVLFGSLLAATSASAAMIQGTLTFSGDIQLATGDTLATTSDLDFLGDDFDVDGAIGDFAGAGIGQGDFGDISDFDLALTDTATVNVGGLTFTLQSVEVLAQASNFLVLKGDGVLTGAGYDATQALFTLTANNSGHLNVYSASITAVPAPGALWLLGSALVALGARRRNG